jgi:2,4-dichlorophenol 6-monooxygenase
MPTMQADISAGLASPFAGLHSTVPAGEADRTASELQSPFSAGFSGDLYDPRCAWVRHRQIASDGAILVRPDRFIAWRCPAGSGEPQAGLAAALSQILARPAGTPAASAA